MKIRFHHAKILTLIADTDYLEGELWVEDNRISYVGPTNNDHHKIIWDREIDVKNNLIMPGFKNAHTHSPMTFLRSSADDKPLFDWLTESIFPYEKKLTPDDVYDLSKLAILEYLSSGITANFDMYFYPEAVAQASVDLGMRTAIVGGAQSIKDMNQLYLSLNNRSKNKGLISYELGFHAEYTTSLERLQEISELANHLKTGVYTHISETKKEVEDCQQKYGDTPVALLEKIGLFNHGGGGFHGVHFTDHDIKLFKERNLSIVLNNSANLKLASGIAPIPKFIENNLTIAIGTDGPASNNCLDMFREMFLTAGLGKVQSSAESVPGNVVLKMATQGGAKAMNLTNSMDLSVGSYADLIIIDLNQPNMQPLNNIVKNIVYSGSKTNIKLTMINGQILFEDGNYYLNNDDPIAIYEKANHIANRILHDA